MAATMKDGKIFLFIFAVIIACFTIYSVINMESEGELQQFEKQLIDRFMYLGRVFLKIYFRWMLKETN